MYVFLGYSVGAANKEGYCDKFSTVQIEWNGALYHS
jgi:hypothetical protein